MSDSDALHPLVSIIIPVYNGGDFLREAIESALSQTYEKKEIIIVNDGSEDEDATEEIARSYGDRVRYFKKPNGGVSSALNYGIAQMNGHYFSWLSHDDMYLPKKIEKQVELLNTIAGEHTVALCSSRHINSKSDFIGRIETARFDQGRIIEWGEALYSVLKNGAFNGCALLIPRTVFDKCGLFNEKYRYIQDSEMWIRIFSSGFSLAYSNDADVLNRVHAAQQTQKNRALFYSESRELANEILPVLAGKSSEKYNFVYAYAYRCAHHGNNELVRCCSDYSKNALRFSLTETLKLEAVLCYGKVRPIIRRLYYAVFRGIKTS